MSLVEYLTKLGYSHASEKRNEYWYLSPFREEQTPSFKINIEKNIWYDFSLGRGGKCIDFIALYFKTDVRGAIRQFYKHSLSFHQQNVFRVVDKIANAKKQYKIIAEKELVSDILIKYLKERKLNIDICKKYCKELIYTMNDKRYFGVAFKNNSGGYEVRNSYFKGCLIKKDSTTLSYRSDRIRVFESWSDFIAYLTLYPSNEQTSDYIILNSLSLLDKSLDIILYLTKVLSYF